jgi:hypothetical protein
MGSYRYLLLCVTMFVALGLQASSAFSAEFPNEERCTEPQWGYLAQLDEEWGTVNICSYPVEMWFIARSTGTFLHTIVPAGAKFRTGLKLPEFDVKHGWASATCRAGMMPNPMFSSDMSADTEDAFVHDRYTCRKP